MEQKWRFSIPPLNTENLKKGMEHLRTTTLPDAISKVRSRVSGTGLAYDRWFREQHEADEEELARERETEFAYAPCISILVPVYMTPELSLRGMIESVLHQTYGNFELCLVDGSQAKGELPIVRAEAEEDTELSVIEKVYSLETERIIRQYMEDEPRIRYIKMEVNQGISGNCNRALSEATGDYVALLDHDDTLTEDALYQIVSALQEERFDVLYTDEDKMSENGSRYMQPHFKPDYNPDLLRACNYISHLFVAKRALMLQCGGFHSEYDGAQNYDMALRCCEGERSVKHIARVLYHARVKEESAEEHELKASRIMHAGKAALEAHLLRMRLLASVAVTNQPGVFKLSYDTPGNPLVSIVVTGHTERALMEKLLEPLYEKTRYSSFEIIIVDQDRHDEKLQEYYHQMQSKRRNIIVVQAPDNKCKTELRNIGSLKSKGNYLLFLDANVEIADPASIGQMVGICMREDVAIVSGTLYDDRDFIYHAGLALGGKELYTYLYRNVRKMDERAWERQLRTDETGELLYFGMNYDYSIVADHCMLVKKSVFVQLGGFADKFRTELSNLDFCLRVREHGLLIVQAAHAVWQYHDLPNPIRLISEAEKQDEETYRRESDLFEILWSHVLKNGDPFSQLNKHIIL